MADGVPRRIWSPAMTRLLGVVAAVAMAFGALVMAITMHDVDRTPTCAAVRSGSAAVPSDRQCFDGSEARKWTVFGLGVAGAASAAAAAILATAFAVGGARVRILAAAIVLALSLSALSILVGAA